FNRETAGDDDRVDYRAHYNGPAQLVTDALVMAIWHRGRCDALLHHSDRGSSQYTSEQFQIASFGKAVLVHAFVKGINERCARLCRAAAQHSNDRGLKLSTRRERPSGCRAAKQRDERAAPCMSGKEHCEG